MKTNKGFVSIIAIILVIVALIIAVIWIFNSRPQPQPEVKSSAPKVFTQTLPPTSSN